MSYFPADMPGLEETMDDAEFWEFCAKRDLRFQACADCGALRHPPSPICANCHSTKVEWRKAPDEALIYTFTVVHHAGHPAVKSNLPYVIGLVEFPELPGVRLVTNITDIPPSSVKIGMKVCLWWDDIGDGMYAPRFRP